LLPEPTKLLLAEKPETLAYNLDTHPVTASSVPADIDVAMMSYFLTPTSEPKLANPDEVQEAVMIPSARRLRIQTVSRIGS